VICSSPLRSVVLSHCCFDLYRFLAADPETNRRLQSCPVIRSYTFNKRRTREETTICEGLRKQAPTYESLTSSVELETNRRFSARHSFSRKVVLEAWTLRPHHPQNGLLETWRHFHRTLSYSFSIRPLVCIAAYHNFLTPCSSTLPFPHCCLQP
jgi:hypothetical protein